jgi:signal transduction histidine kinase
MRFNSLAFRLFATSLVWTLVVLPVAGFIIVSLFRNDLYKSFDNNLITLVDTFTLDGVASATSTPATPTVTYQPLFDVTHSGWYWQIKPVAGTQGPRLVSASLATAHLESPSDTNVQPDKYGRRWKNTKGPAGESIRTVERIEPLGLIPGNPQYSITVAGPLWQVETPVSEFRFRLAVPLALAGLGLVAANLFQVRFGLLPLQKILQGLAAIRSGKATRLEGEPPAEIEPLQTELNALIESNQEIVDRARTQVGNLAHALKTPLAVITNEAREEKSEFGKKVAEQASFMRFSINHYLDRARIAARTSVIGTVTPVPEVIEPLVRALERIHREKEVGIIVDCPADATFRGEKHDLEEMLGNLLDNACKWARKRVTFRATIGPARAGGSGRKLRIVIEDDGPGLTPEERARIGKRGVRLDEAVPGSGLGLSIVRDLAHSYQGQLELDQAGSGGLAVRLELPAA